MLEKYDDDVLTIDFKALFKVLWVDKWLILVITILFLFGGGLYILMEREEFVSEGKIMPEISGGVGSSLGGLADLVGIGGFELGLKNNTDAIRPDIYPDVIKSTPFFLELFEQKFIDKSGDSLFFNTFYNSKIENNKKHKEKYLTKFKGEPTGVLVLNRLTENRIKDLKERINGTIDRKSGVICISVKMPDPVMAAEIANFAMNYLTNYVTNYRTEKVKQEVDFLGRKVAAARGEFYKDQSRKASYADRFAAPTIRLQSADVQRERLESEYKLSATVYNELLKKYEEAKIKLHQVTPIFQVLEPPVVGNIKIGLRRYVVLVIAMLIGLVVGISLVILKNVKNVFIF
jgi:uncharacterized protein involved in exopolysaccharide biosynthesis